MAHRMRNVTADGAEWGLVFHLDLCVGEMQGLGHFVERRVATDAISLIGQRKDVAIVLRMVEFIFNLTDDLLQHILDRDQTRDVAEFIDHDGHVVAVVAKLAQQVVEFFALRNEARWTQQGAQVQLWRTL